MTLQATRSIESWGASQSAWLYQARIARGFPFAWGHDLQATLTSERRIDSTGQPLTQAGGLLRYYAPWTRASALYASASYDRIGTAAAPDQLLLGGDNGLRGYPLRYQAGEKRALATVEQRVYTDWYPFRLVRVGGAVFYDYGRAWSGVNQNVVNPGWLSDAGVGLRLAFDRAGFANVLHVDLAFPFNRAPGDKSVQFLVKTYLTF
jgi:outer membrane translocation and assembly module TamA